MPVRQLAPDAGQAVSPVEMRPVTEAGPIFATGGPPPPSSTYASVGDVEAIARARKIGQGNNPTADDVSLYIELAAGEIDSILVNKGYSVPIASTAPESTRLLRTINARGALLMLEDASPTPGPNTDRIRREWEADLEKLASAEFSLDAPLNIERTRPRGPGLNAPPLGTLQSKPFFRRDQCF